MSAPKTMKAAPFLIFGRELGRASKKWTGPLLRIAIGGSFFGLFVIAYVGTFFYLEENEWIADVNAAEFGQSAFYTGLFLWIGACILIPAILAIQAIHEERDSRTLDLLAMSGLSNLRVITGLMVSRTYRAFLLLTTPAPLLALLPSFGGVSLTDASLGLLGGAAAFVVTTAVAMPIAVAARGLPLALIGVLGWWMAIPWLIPALITEGTRAPIEFMYLVFAAGLSAALLGPPIAAWSFSRGIRSGWDRGSKSWPGWRFGWLIHVVIQGVGWISIELPSVLYPLHLAFMIPLVVSSSILFLRASLWILPRLGMSRTRNRIRVFGDPIFWRETFTLAHGGLSRVFFVAAVGVILVGAAAVALSILDEELVLFLGVASVLWLIVAPSLAILMALSSTLQERRLGTVPLVVLTGYPPWRVTAMKTLAVTAPTLVIGLILGFFTLVAVAIHAETIIPDILNANITAITETGGWLAAGLVVLLGWIAAWFACIHTAIAAGISAKSSLVSILITVSYAFFTAFILWPAYLCCCGVMLGYLLGSTPPGSAVLGITVYVLGWLLITTLLAGGTFLTASRALRRYGPVRT